MSVNRTDNVKKNFFCLYLTKTFRIVQYWSCLIEFGLTNEMSINYAILVNSKRTLMIVFCKIL